MSGARRDRAWLAALLAAAAGFAFLLFGGLSRPLMWNDEAYTAMYAERVLDRGYPVVHDGRNVVYGLDAPVEVGTKEGSDAYIGSPWGQYYVAAIGALAARGTDDPYAKTRWLRLPFALLGCAGVACFLLAALPLVPGRRARIAFAAAHLLAGAASVSLLLHLREVRYYALAVLFGGLVVLAFRRREIGRAREPFAGALLALALIGAFACYYPAFGVLVACLAIDALRRAIRAEGGAAGRARELAARIAPVAAACAVALPAAVYLEVPRVLAALREGFEPTLAAWTENLAVVAGNLLRFEWLAPVVAVKLLLAVTRWLDPVAAPAPDEAPRRELSGFLTLVLAVYVLVVSRAPFVFERYFVVLSPLLTTLMLLDASRATSRLRASPRLRRSLPVRLLAGAAAACLVGSLFARAPELRGRLAEIAEPVVGPLDVAIPYLLSRYPHPRELVLATNYEDPAYMYYLGSRVIVGFNATALARDREETPDVVIPRRPRHREVLLHFLGKADYERRSFPVYNTVTNQVPSLSPWTPGLDVHRFATRLPRRPAQEVVIFERSGAGG